MTVPMSDIEFQHRLSRMPEIPNWEKDTHWGKYRKAMKDHMYSNDMSEMLMWSTVTATMFVGEFHVTKSELEELKKSPRWTDYSRRALIESTFGSPPRMSELTYTSGNLVHQTYHLWQWEKSTNMRIEDAGVIVEFGGGYGAMCAIARRMGFKGTYHLIDYPEMTLLQEYYLSNLGYEASYIPADWDTDFRDYSFSGVDVLFAIHSLSEAPIQQRDNFLSALTPVSWLFSFQENFFNIDNKLWFEMFINSRKGYDHAFTYNKYNSNINYLVSCMKGIHV